MKEIRQLVDDCIENQLSFHLEQIGSSEDVILYIAEAIEGACKLDLARGASLALAYEILIPRILANKNFEQHSDPAKLPIEHILEAGAFACDYFHLRNLIYYSHAVESSIRWKQDGHNITIDVEDPTIFRQYLAEKHSFMMNSQERWPGNVLKHDRVIEMLRGKSLSDPNNQELTKAFESIKAEADHKIRYQFLGLGPNSNVDIGGFSFAQFLTIYKELLSTALFERMNAIANDLSCVITYPQENLINAVHSETGIPADICSRILHAISRSSGFSFCYIELTKKFLLSPFTFSLRDGTSDILKLFAKERNEEFSSRASGPIGDAIVADVGSYFSGFRNFRVVKEIQLQKYSKELPDIDLLIVSYEPSLGFHVFVCECKNTLYSSWAKEYLKGFGKKGFITKAISQVTLLKTFLGSDEGNRMLIDIVVKEFSHLDVRKLFPDGFMVLKDFIIISSQSVGMFYEELDMSIVSAQLLRKIVHASDGDCNYIKGCLRTLKDTIDQSYTKSKSTIKIENNNISFDTASIKHYVYFPKHTYLSSGELENLEQLSAETGYTFVDNLNKGREMDSPAAPSDSS
jgi:hypothetical protein